MSQCQIKFVLYIIAPEQSEIYKEVVIVLKHVGCRPERPLDCEIVGCGYFSDEAQTAAVLIIDCVYQPRPISSAGVAVSGCGDNISDPLRRPNTNDSSARRPTTQSLQR